MSDDDEYQSPPWANVGKYEICPIGTRERLNALEAAFFNCVNQRAEYVHHIAKLEAALDTLEESRARAYMRLQCADVPRDPWAWEVSEILSHSGANASLLARQRRT